MIRQLASRWLILTARKGLARTRAAANFGALAYREADLDRLLGDNDDNTVLLFVHGHHLASAQRRTAGAL